MNRKEKMVICPLKPNVAVMINSDDIKCLEEGCLFFERHNTSCSMKKMVSKLQ